MKRADAIYITIMLMIAGLNLYIAVDSFVMGKITLGTMASLISALLMTIGYSDMRTISSRRCEEDNCRKAPQ